MSDESLSALKQIWTQRMRTLSTSQLLATPEFGFVLIRWIRWGEADEVIAQVRPIFESDETLPKVLEKYLHFGTRHVSGDVAATRVPLLNPRTFEQFVDIYALEARVRTMLARHDLTENQRIAANQYLWAMGRIREGKDPGSMRDD